MVNCNIKRLIRDSSSEQIEEILTNFEKEELAKNPNFINKLRWYETDCCYNRKLCKYLDVDDNLPANDHKKIRAYALIELKSWVESGIINLNDV